MSDLDALKARLAEVFGVTATEVLPVRGPGHALDLAFRAAPGGSVCAPASALTARLAALYGATVEEGAADRVEPLEAGAVLIASPERVAALEAALDPDALPPALLRDMAAAVTPARLALAEARRLRRLAAAERLAAGLGAQVTADGRVRLTGADPVAFARYGVRAEADGDTVVVDPDQADLVLIALGRPAARPRVGEILRETKETRIACLVDLDRPGPVKASTGLGFYDHMLEQVSFHGGFALSLTCEGDLEIDAHHTVEDCAITFGQALKAALGDRLGIARFGFVLPMDESEAKVSVDLGGRPYSVFDGRFASARIGDYPTEMTAHVFRSLAEGLGAAIHVSVTGQNDHHKTEACFKALGRALRQAVRIEGEALPSTKGVIE